MDGSPLTSGTVLGYSSDFIPHVGEVPGKKGQFIMAGFTGYGMPKILLTSKEVATMVRGDVPFDKTSLPSSFETTVSRIQRKRSALQASLEHLWPEKRRSNML